MIEKGILSALLKCCEDNQKTYGKQSTGLVKDHRIYYKRGPHDVEHLVHEIFKQTKGISKNKIRAFLMQPSIGNVNKKGQIVFNFINEDGTLSNKKGNNLVVKTTKRMKHQEDKVVNVFVPQHANIKDQIIVTGKVKKHNGSYVLEPTDTAQFGNIIYITSSKIDLSQVVNTDKIVALKTIPGSDVTTVGYGIVESQPLGRSGEIGTKIDAIKAEGEYNQELSAEVIDELDKVPNSVSNSDIELLMQQYGGRVFDWRNEYIPTTDPKGAKDKDDGSQCVKLPDGTYRLRVPISLVSYYVKKTSAIFKDALNKGNSTYIADTVDPMLPRELSNNICSLNQDEYRLALGAEIIINAEGNVIKSTFAPAIVKPTYCLTYEDADAILAGDENAINNFSKVVNNFLDARELENIMRPKSEDDGFLKFDTTEPTFRLNEDRSKIVKVASDNSTLSHKIVETAMLTYNEAFAKYCEEHNIPIIYRVEEDLSSEQAGKVFELLQNLNIPVECDSDKCGMNDIINNAIAYAENVDIANASKYKGYYSKGCDDEIIDDKPFTHAVSNMLIRFFPRAEYSAYNIGHSATNKRCYTHITSPIRRCTDLINQMQFTAYLRGEELPFKQDELRDICDHLNECECKSESFERKADDALASYYVQSHALNKTVVATVTRISANKVELASNFMTITLPLTNLYDGKCHIKRGGTAIESKNRELSLRIGQVCKVKLTGVDVQSGLIFGEVDKSNIKEADFNYKQEANNGLGI